jgi:hypothetical protein
MPRRLSISFNEQTKSSRFTKKNLGKAGVGKAKERRNLKGKELKHQLGKRKLSKLSFH